MSQRRIMKSKSFFKQFKKEIEDEKKNYKAYGEVITITGDRCNHKGKAKIVNGILRCSCGAAWSGNQIEKLLDLLNKKD
jgi:hypothetical protein